MNKSELLDAIRTYSQSKNNKSKFKPGIDPVSVSGASISDDDIAIVCDAVLSGWFTEGEYAKKFEHRLKEFLGLNHVVLCNSGSSANLIAMMAMKEQHNVERKKVITCATGFPTTISPIIQAGLIPYFVDINPYTLNPDTNIICSLLAQDDVAGVIQAHTLGFPFDAISICQASAKNEKFFIEDNCDSMSSLLDGELTGRFGDVSTYSFFPAHTITTGEGGAVIMDSSKLYRLSRSYRDWGRDCWCLPGQDNTCGKRFGWNWSFMPENYDHKYTFARVGYNLKMTDIQAALGWSQMDRLPYFVSTRIENYAYLLAGLSDLQDHLQFVAPLSNADPSPFGFPISVISGAFTAVELIAFLEKRNIRTRPLFAGNIIKHPMMKDVTYRVAEDLSGSDWVMENTFWIGCHPGLGNLELDYVIESIREFIKSKSVLYDD